MCEHGDTAQAWIKGQTVRTASPTAGQAQCKPVGDLGCLREGSGNIKSTDNSILHLW